MAFDWAKDEVVHQVEKEIEDHGAGDRGRLPRRQGLGRRPGRRLHGTCGRDRPRVSHMTRILLGLRRPAAEGVLAHRLRRAGPGDGEPDAAAFKTEMDAEAASCCPT